MAKRKASCEGSSCSSHQLDEGPTSMAEASEMMQQQKPSAAAAVMQCNVKLPRNWHNLAATSSSFSAAAAAAVLPPDDAVGGMASSSSSVSQHFSIKCSGSIRKLKKAEKKGKNIKKNYAGEDTSSAAADPGKEQQLQPCKNKRKNPATHSALSQEALPAGHCAQQRAPSASGSSKASSSSASHSQIMKKQLNYQRCISSSSSARDAAFNHQLVHQQQQQGSSVGGSMFSVVPAAAAPPPNSQQQQGPPNSTRDACENILAAIQRSSVVAAAAAASSSSTASLPDGGGSGGCAGEVQISLDHILSKVPYKDMLRDLFGSNASTTQGYRAPAIPVVSRYFDCH